MENVRSPGVSTWMPSAIVGASFTVVTAPLRWEMNMEGTADDCTPMTFTLGRMDLIATATPLTSPPPPMGTTTCSTSGTWSRISRPIVP